MNQKDLNDIAEDLMGLSGKRHAVFNNAAEKTGVVVEKPPENAAVPPQLGISEKVEGLGQIKAHPRKR